MTTYTKTHLKRGTIVEFIGAAHADNLHFHERQVAEFFEKYGLQVGDKGKIWEGYRGSWIRITWTLQDGTTAYRVPMRSGNFKVVTAKTESESESDSDSVPELESNEVDKSVTPSPLRNSKLESSSSVMFGFDSPTKERSTSTVERSHGDDELSMSFERTLTNRCVKVQSLQRENSKLKKEATWLHDQVYKVEHREVKSRAMMEMKDRRNEELVNQIAMMRQQLDHYENGWTTPTNYDENKGFMMEDQSVLPMEEQNWDDWAMGIQSKVSTNMMFTEAQQSVLTNLARSMDDVKARLDTIDHKVRKDKATVCLQSVAKNYLANKREDAEWVVPDIGSG